MNPRSTAVGRSAAHTLSVTLLCAALCACASSGNNVDITKPITGEASTNAEKAYRKGLEEKSSSGYLEATRYFEWVRNNFPYSQYAALSELALSDMAFERDDFTGSAVSYGEFVKSHPSHPKADYASFRVGLSHFSDRASESFLLPPAHEKDQGPVRLALESFQKFLRAFPKSGLVTEARRLSDECRERLAAHERYVADFYWKKQAWKGAAGRYLSIADTYGDLRNGSVKAEALWRAGESLAQAGQQDEEREVLERLLAETTQTERRRDAQTRLAELQRLKALPKPSPAPAPAPDGKTDAAPAPAAPPPAAPAPAPADKPSAPPPPEAPKGAEAPK
jgi:outer membrane protein assembly factor BamD